MLVATIDTNVIVSGLRSASGFANQVLLELEAEAFTPAITQALFLEYEDVLNRDEQRQATGLTTDEVAAFLDAFAALSKQVPSLFYRWRPVVSDEKDDLVVECAVASNSRYLVTQNVRDFREVQGQFQFEIVRPMEFIKIIRRR